jgi:hypothetical protein
MSRVKVEVEEGEIVVTDLATEWRVSYRHSKGVNSLVATQVVTDAKAKVSERSKFLAVAFRKASDRVQARSDRVRVESRPMAIAVKDGLSVADAQADTDCRFRRSSSGRP